MTVAREPENIIIQKVYLIWNQLGTSLVYNFWTDHLILILFSLVTFRKTVSFHTTFIDLGWSSPLKVFAESLSISLK